jgi:hypothetical protein
MVAVAALAVGLVVLTPALLRISGFGGPRGAADVVIGEPSPRTNCETVSR